MSQTHLPPMVQLHLGVALLGFSGLFAKLIDLSALDIIAHRSWLTALGLGVFLLFNRHKLRLHSAKDYAVATILGILAGLHWLTYFGSIQYTSVAVGMIALFTYPVMGVILEPLLFGRRPSTTDLAITFVVLFAISLLFPNLWQDDVELTEDFIFGVGLGLFSALCFALRNIGLQHYFKGYSGTQSMFYQFLVAAVMFIPFAPTSAFDLKIEQMQMLIILAILFSALAHVLFASSITLTGARTAGLVACLQPLYGVLLSMLLLSEMPPPMTIIGGIIIVAAAIFETVKASKS